MLILQGLDLLVFGTESGEDTIVDEVMRANCEKGT